MASRKRTFLLSLVLVLGCAALVVPFILRRTHNYYTDGDRLQEPEERARGSIRDVLWEPPAPLEGEINRPDLDEYEPRIHPDGDLLVFTRGRAGENADLWAARRRGGRWADPAPLEEVNSPRDDLGASFSRDGNLLLFYSNRKGGEGGYDLWISRKRGGRFRKPRNMGPAINSPFNELSPALTPDGRGLYFASDRLSARDATGPWPATLRMTLRSADYSIFLACREEGKEGGEFGEPAPVERLNAAGSSQGSVAVSPRGDFIYFASNRPGGKGGFDLYRARLAGGIPQDPENLGPQVNTPASELDPALSAGGFRLYFSRGRGGREDIFVTSSREVYLVREKGETFWSLAALLHFINWILSRIHPAVLAILLSLLVCLLFWLLFGRRMGTLRLLTRCFLLALLVHLLLAIWMNYQKVQDMLIEITKREELNDFFPVDLEASAEGDVGMAIRDALAEGKNDELPALTPEQAALSPPLPEITPLPDRDRPALEPDRPEPAEPESEPLPREAPSPVVLEAEPPRVDLPDPTPDPLPPPIEIRQSSRPRVEEDRSPAPLAGERRVDDSIPVEVRPLEVARSRAVQRPLEFQPPEMEKEVPGPVRMDLPLDTSLPLPSVRDPEPAPIPIEARAGIPVPEPAPEPERLIPRGPAAVETSPERPLEVPEAAIRPSRPPGKKENIPLLESIPEPPIAPPAPESPLLNDPAPPALAASRRDRDPVPAPLKKIPGEARPPYSPSPGRSPGLETLVRRPPPASQESMAPAETAPVPLPIPRTAPDRSSPLEASVQPTSSNELAGLVRPVAPFELEMGIEPAPLERAESSSSFVPRLYKLRSKSRREEALRAGGGDELTEQAVERGLAWLAIHQSPDGRWSLADFTNHLHRPDDRDLYHPGWTGRGRNSSKGGGGRASQGETAATGLALLAFLGHGDSHLSPGPHRETVRRGLSWLLGRQKSDGDLRGGGNLYMHAIASFALCEAHAFTRDDRLRDAAQRAIDFTAKSQNPARGGWRYEPYPQSRDVDTSVFGWMLMAMKSARLGGLRLDEKCLRLAAKYLDSARMTRAGGRYAYQPGNSRTSMAMTAQGFFCQFLLADHFKKEAIWSPANIRRSADESVRYLLANLPRAADQDGTNIYYWYYATLALFQEGGPAWESWNEALKRILLGLQVGDEHGSAAGSWDPIDRRSQSGGRVCSTALCVLCLEVYYRYARLREE